MKQMRDNGLLLDAQREGLTKMKLDNYYSPSPHALYEPNISRTLMTCFGEYSQKLKAKRVKSNK